jgi:hypothetical protein
MLEQTSWSCASRQHAAFRLRSIAESGSDRANRPPFSSNLGHKPTAKSSQTHLLLRTLADPLGAALIRWGGRMDIDRIVVRLSSPEAPEHRGSQRYFARLFARNRLKVTITADVGVAGGAANDEVVVDSLGPSDLPAA